MAKHHELIVKQLVQSLRPSTILDCPCGEGWLGSSLSYHPVIDGIDLYKKANNNYRKIQSLDLNDGIPDSYPSYECIVCCEGLEHLGNPELFLRTARAHLEPSGALIITTPNAWYIQSRFQYLIRGFWPSFPCLIGKVNRGDHMHIMPWTFPQIYLFLELAGYKKIELYGKHEALGNTRPYEKLFSLPQRWYCSEKIQKAKTMEELGFWKNCGSKASLYSRNLIVIASTNSTPGWEYKAPPDNKPTRGRKN